jgi:hypothetical protein
MISGTTTLSRRAAGAAERTGLVKLAMNDLIAQRWEPLVPSLLPPGSRYSRLHHDGRLPWSRFLDRRPPLLLCRGNALPTSGAHRPL